LASRASQVLKGRPAKLVPLDPRGHQGRTPRMEPLGPPGRGVRPDALALGGRLVCAALWVCRGCGVRRVVAASPGQQECRVRQSTVSVACLVPLAPPAGR